VLPGATAIVGSLADHGAYRKAATDDPSASVSRPPDADFAALPASDLLISGFSGLAETRVLFCCDARIASSWRSSGGAVSDLCPATYVHSSAATYHQIPRSSHEIPQIFQKRIALTVMKSCLIEELDFTPGGHS
jgi:hypothetical protein